MMRRMFEELCSLLDTQKGILEKMLELSREERRIIIGGEAELLEGIVRLELRELSKLNASEKKRMALIKAISAEFNLPARDMTVTSIAERAEAEERVAIVKLQRELTGLIRQHTDINDENKELIKAHIEYSEAMLNLMVESEDPLNNFYCGDGKAAPEKKKSTGFFDGTA